MPAERHVVYVGTAISGAVKLADGSAVDVTPEVVVVDSLEKAAEVAHAVGQAFAKHGHPDHWELDEKTGERVQRPFVYDDGHHKKHGAKKAPAKKTAKKGDA